MKTSLLLFALALGFGRAHASDGSKDHEKNAPAPRNIISSQLPSKLLTSIRKNYKNYWITNLYKESLNGKVSYFITLENADQTVKLNTSRTTGWSIFRVVPKDSDNR